MAMFLFNHRPMITINYFSFHNRIEDKYYWEVPMTEELRRDEFSISLRFKTFIFSLRCWIGPKTVIILLCVMLSLLFVFDVLDAETFKTLIESFLR